MTLSENNRASKPTISIALCTYNGEYYLEEQLASYKTQTIQPNELVVCDDGSTDSTVAIIEKFAGTTDFPVHLHINDKNLGSTRNFEKSISLCKGDLIALSDQDDIWLPNKLERQVAALNSDSDSCGAFSNADIVDAKGILEGYTLWDSIKFDAKAIELFQQRNAYEVLASKNAVTGATLILKKSCLCNIFPAPIESVHDAWITWILSAKGHLTPINDRLILYRQHPNNQIGARRLSIRDKIARGRPPSKQKAHTAIACEANAVLERLDSFHVINDRQRNILIGRSKHYTLRAQSEQCYLKRATMILRELIKGNYHKYSGGIRSAIRDLVYRKLPAGKNS